MPGVPNGTVCQEEEELHAEHHGPELQRTGRFAQTSCFCNGDCRRQFRQQGVNPQECNP